MDNLSNEIKIFFFDIDSTTFDHSIFAVRPSTMYGLRKLKEKGYKICICTSRSLDEMRELPKDFLDLMDGFVTLAGAALYMGDQSFTQAIDHEEVIRGLKYLDEKNITYRYVLRNGIGYLNHPDSDKEALFYRLYQMIPEIKPYEKQEVVHILYYTTDENVFADLEELMPTSYTMHLRIANEITPQGIHKGKEMIHLAELFGFKQKNVAAFGDGINDIPMLQDAKLGIAMGNAQDIVKLAADYVTDDISNEGLYKALVHFGFIEDTFCK